MSLGNKTWPFIAIASMAMAGYGYFYHDLNPKTVVVEKVVTKEIHPEMPLEVYLPKNRQKLSLKDKEPIKFIWSGWDKEARYQLTVQNEFNETANIDLKTNEVDLRIENGSHFRWSLKSVSNKYGIKSAQGEFFVEKEVAPAVVAAQPVPEQAPARMPASAQVQEEVSFNVADKKIVLNYPENSIKLSWKGNQEGRYRFLITRLSDKKIVVEDEVQGLTRPVFFTNPGVYQISLVDLSKQSIEAADSLIITFKKKIGAFNSTQPFDVAGPSVQVNFNIYEGQTARLRAFYKDSKAEIGSFKVQGNSHRFVLKKKGEYCFELLNDDSPKNLSASEPVCAKFGEEQKREIASVPSYDVVPPGKTILNYYKINGVDTYQFDLPEISGATDYEIRLYGDQKAQNLIREVKLKGRRVFWKTQRELKTYIQYRAFNKTQGPTPWSEVGELIFPISPLEIN